MICYGLSGKKYSLIEVGDNRFIGGEGKVYRVVENKTIMAKVFSERSLSEYRDSLYKHILWLSKQGFTENFEGFKIAWPKDLLFSENIQIKGQEHIFFCGYIMQRIEHICSLDTALTDEGIIGKRATLKDKLQVAYNYASFVNAFHKAGLIIGDFNLNNVLLTKHGNLYKISFIDCGGFSHFEEKLNFGARLWQEDWPEAPERKLKIKECHTLESDLFYLAVVMFRIIVFNGNPFVGYSEDEDTEVEAEDNLANGICLYIKKYKDYYLPDYYPKAGFIPDDILSLFNKAFNYDRDNLRKRMEKRATAQDWVDTLYKYQFVSGANKIIQCKKNKQHVYFSHLTKCPWCNPSSVADLPFEQRHINELVSEISSGKSNITDLEYDHNDSFIYRDIGKGSLNITNDEELIRQFDNSFNDIRDYISSMQHYKDVYEKAYSTEEKKQYANILKSSKNELKRKYNRFSKIAEKITGISDTNVIKELERKWNIIENDIEEFLEYDHGESFIHRDETKGFLNGTHDKELIEQFDDSFNDIRNYISFMQHYKDVYEKAYSTEEKKQYANVLKSSKNELKRKYNRFSKIAEKITGISDTNVIKELERKWNIVENDIEELDAVIKTVF